LGPLLAERVVPGEHGETPLAGPTGPGCQSLAGGGDDLVDVGEMGAALPDGLVRMGGVARGDVGLAADLQACPLAAEQGRGIRRQRRMATAHARTFLSPRAGCEAGVIRAPVRTG